jgi:hypothetical protein
MPILQYTAFDGNHNCTYIVLQTISDRKLQQRKELKISGKIQFSEVARAERPRRAR